MKSLSKGGIYYLIYNVLNMAFPFLTGMYVARILLTESIGTVGAAQNVSRYFVILAFLGIPTYGLREISKVRDNPQERSKVYSELYVINFISTIVFLTAYLILIFAVPIYRQELTLYLIVGISIALNMFNISWLFEGMEQFRFISIRNIIFKAVSFAFLVLFVRSDDDMLLYALVTVVGTAGNYIVNMFYAPRYVKFTLKDLNLRRHMKSIMYLVVVNLAIELYSLIDITMMNFMCDKDCIAYYKYAIAVKVMLLQVLNTFTMVLVPRISYYYKEGKYDEFNKLLSKALKLIIICSVPMIVGLYFTADTLMVKIYGDKYIVTAQLLKILSMMLLISPIGYLLGSRVLLASNHENRMIISVGSGAVVNIIGNAILIPKYAEFGASIASVFSEIVVMVIYVAMGKKYFKLEGVSGSVVKVAVSVALMGGYLYVCSLLPLNEWVVLGIQIAGAVLIYFATLLIMKESVVREYADGFIRKIKKTGGNK